MHGEVRGLSKCFTACTASVRFLASMRPFMTSKMSQDSETILTLTALVRLFTTVNPLTEVSYRDVCFYCKFLQRYPLE